MKPIDLSEHIAALRKARGITQEQLAEAVGVSAQAVSKWETAASLPDIQTLPLIADFFRVSIDYLYYGKDVSYDDIYEKAFAKTAASGQMDAASFEEALKLFAAAHHGVSHGNLRGKNKNWLTDPGAVHISGENGVSVFDGDGFGGIVTRRFFETIDRQSAPFAAPLFALLGDPDRLLVVMAIVSMSDIAYTELSEKLGMTDTALRAALDELIAQGLVNETVSKHKALGTTYQINEIYHSAVCLLLAVSAMQQRTTAGNYCCCMGYGDFPIRF